MNKELIFQFCGSDCMLHVMEDVLTWWGNWVEIMW